MLPNFSIMDEKMKKKMKKWTWIISGLILSLISFMLTYWLVPSVRMWPTGILRLITVSFAGSFGFVTLIYKLFPHEKESDPVPNTTTVNQIESPTMRVNEAIREMQSSSSSIPTEDSQCNVKAVRELIESAFMDVHELVDFCEDHFPELSVTTTDDIRKIRRNLINYCRSRVQMVFLLEKIRETNPSMYAKFSEQLRG